MSNISTEQFCQKLHVRRCVRNSAFLNWFKIPGLRFDDMGFRTRIRASQSCTYFLRYMITQWHQGQVIGSSAIKRHGSSGWCKSRSLRFVLAVSIEGGAFFEPTLGNCTNLVSGESMILISFIDYVQLGSITLLALILHHWNLATWTLIQCRVLYSLTSLCFKENEFWNANSSSSKSLKFWQGWVCIRAEDNEFGDQDNEFGWRTMSFKLMDFEVHLASPFPMSLAMLNHVEAETHPPH